MDNVTVNIGHAVTCSLEYFDQNGNPMLTPPTPDSPPAWTQSAADVETSVVSPDGSTDTLTAVKAGADTVGVTVVVGGKSFTAQVGVTVSPAPQVLTSVGIATAVN